MKWETDPAFEPLLTRVLASASEMVRKAPARCVTRHCHEGRWFYVKNYFYGVHLLEPLKYFFKNSPSRSEWQTAPHLIKLGIRIVPHLAHGEQWSWRGLLSSVLITEGPRGFVPLNKTSTSTLVQKALGRFLGQIHSHAISHNDLHISNLLWSADAGEFCLVDLDNIEIHSTLTPAQRLDNLATLHRRFPLSPDFYAAYDPQFFNDSTKVEELAGQKHRASIPKKLKLLFKHRFAFAPKKIGDLQWHVRSNSWNEKLEAILQGPDEFLATRAHLLKNGTRSTVGEADGLVLKRFNFKKISSVIFDLVRASRARRGFRIARHLELLKIATPLPIAYADRRRLGFVVRSYFVMEKILGATYLWERAGDRPKQILRLAELIAKIHHEGFSHRDLKETNIISNTNGTPYLIDLDALHYVGKISNARATVELARLARGFARRGKISNIERLRFLKHYCACRRISDWRWWWNQVGKNLAAK
jgi:tRNA A-37 threonylcarbamoyl transferase component Bud32